jgi:DNA replication protein DnaC
MMCDKCNDTGVIVWQDEDGYVIAEFCECQKKKEFESRMRKSGLLDLFQEFRFDNYQVKGTWQKVIKQKALDFVANPSGNWFFIGGQVGAGKTMICTAIVKELLEKGFDAMYVQYRQEIMKLKMSMEDFGNYTETMNRMKTVKVLYIDDLFKGNNIPSEADIRIIFELLNYRYINKDLITIISTEKNINDIISIDEAIGSRIYQRSRDFQINLAQNKAMNYRLNKGE